MTRYLGSTFSLASIIELLQDSLYGTTTLKVYRLTLGQAQEIYKQGVINVIGHEGTARQIGLELCGEPLPANRVDTRFQRGDRILVFQYLGPRLREGQEMPEGAPRAWLLVEV